MPNLKPFNTLIDLINHGNWSPQVVNARRTKNAQLNKFEYLEYQGAQQQQVVVKKFKDNSYNGPTLFDFVERLEILRETASRLLDSNSSEYAKQLKRIHDAYQTVLLNLNEQCKIEPIELKNILAREKDVIRTIHLALDHLQQFVVSAMTVIEPNVFYPDAKNQTVNQKMKKALARFTSMESKLTVEKQRPNFINYYDLNAITRVSVARSIGEVIPSTERLNHQEGKLPNFVECAMGYQAENSVIWQFQGYRHSSYPPIKILDPFERQRATAEIVKDMLRELARQKIIKVANLKQPIELSLSSLTLLSPIALLEAANITDKYILPPGESEYLQLQESYQALMLYQNREIDLEVDDGKIKVKLDVNLVNAASNPLGVFVAKQGVTGKRLAQSWLEHHINAQGFNQYMRKTEKFLFDRNSVFKDCSLDSPGLTELQVKLSSAYGQLDSLLSSGSQQAYQEQLKAIQKIQDQIFVIETNLMAKRKNFYINNKSLIKVRLKNIEEKLASKNSFNHEKLQIEQLYYQSIAMYMDGKIEPDQFGARYLLVTQKMGHAVDFFCKSGEDRTGRMQNLLEELCEFSRKNRYFPHYNFESCEINAQDVIQQKKIATVVSEFSVSRDINDQNVHGARGLQITSALKVTPMKIQLGYPLKINQGLPNVSGDLMGKLAKQVTFFKQEKIKKAVERAPKANVFLAKHHLQGFEGQLIREEQRKAYELGKYTPVRTPVRAETAVTLSDAGPTYEGSLLKGKELAVEINEYQAHNQKGEPIAKQIVAVLEKDSHGKIRDVTQVSPDACLSLQAERELAMHQAHMVLRPPYKTSDGPVVLSGQDLKQVARIHAALLFLKDSHPSFKDLKISVRGHSERPTLEKNPTKQKQANKIFIQAQLGEAIFLSQQQKEFRLFIEKARNMNQMGSFLEGTSIRPFNDGKK